jgi:hypothetical protein
MLITVGVALAVGGVTVASPPAGAAAVWATPATADPGVGTDYYLRDVSCTASTACTAVGYTSSVVDGVPSALPLIERWNGVSWAIQQSPTVPGPIDLLFGVSCATGSWCVAVGWDNYQQPLAMSWDGSAWTVTSAPAAPGASGGLLTGVSCVSASFCKAAGETQGPSASGRPYALTWNGASWTPDVMALPSNFGDGGFSGVDCSSAHSCAAVGEWQTATSMSARYGLAESWNSTGWHVNNTTHTASQNSLYGVRCPTTTCFAVGSAYTPTGATPYPGNLAEQRIGSYWLAKPVPNVPNSSNELDDVGCSAASKCLAVGFASGQTVNPQAEAAVWNGLLWSLELPPIGPYALRGVSCPTSSFCMSVGEEVVHSRPGGVDTFRTIGVSATRSS